MNTLIAFASKHGTSEKAAEMLAEKLNGQVHLHNLSNNTSINISEYNQIIIGGSIHVGEIQKSVKKFVTNNEQQLKQKNLGLYLCCMDKELAQEQFEKAYPKVLRNAALTTGLFGGELLFDKMNFLERWIIKKINKTTTNTSEIDQAAIDRFANKFNLLP